MPGMPVGPNMAQNSQLMGGKPPMSEAAFNQVKNSIIG